jgi:DNA-binding LacI/PurR family transcriptional regulator/signal transduction histidine kinase
MNGTRHEDARLRTVGILLNWFGDAYSIPIITSIIDAVREAGANAICFAGGRPGPLQRYEQAARVAFDLATRESVDGLILIAGTLVQRFGTEELARLATRDPDLPVVSVALELPGCDSVLVDNESGMRDIVGHLIAHHGYRRIGFIRGPESSPEAERRFRVYREVLSQHGLVVDDAWIAPGMFDGVSGQRAVELLFDQRKADLEALVAANDEMALGAIDALVARGTRVPEQVAVVGFDDTEMSNFATPSLTTVRQPLSKLGRRAATMLLDRLQGRAVSSPLILPTEAVLRESCGCPLRPARAPALRPLSASLPPSQPSLERHAVAVASEIRAAFDAPPLSFSDWATALVEAFVDELRSNQPGLFLKRLEEILRRLATAGEDVWPWQRLLPMLERSFLPWFGRGSPAAAQADEVLAQGRLVIGDVARRAQAHKRLMSERRAHALSNISQALISTVELRELAAVLGQGLPELGVKSGFVCRYEDPERPTEWARLLFRFDVASGPVLEEAPPRFPSRTLVPSGSLPRSFGAVLEPLYFNEEQLGYALLELGPPEAAFYDELRQQLSSALMRLSREEELARLHQAQKERSRELEQAYRILQENQAKLLISEKMAALGRLSAGIAHEMNTPLAAVRTALEELGKLAEEYRSSFGDPRVTADDHREIASDMLNTVRLAGGAAEKVAEFVQGIKFQTRDISSQEQRRFDAVPVVQDTLLLLNHSLRQNGCTIAFEHPAVPVEIFGMPGRLAQVITNLVTNAIDASQCKGGGPIVVALATSGERVELRVSDLGGGIEPTAMKRIFDPMFTTKPFGQGTGLGLSIVHDIVSSEFNGSIEVESRLGEGTTFTLHLASRGE